MLKNSFPIFALTFYTLGICASLGQSQVPSATLYKEVGCTGSSVSLPVSSYSRDLSLVEFNNKAKSVSLIGIWMFYDSANFNTAGDAGMEYYFEYLRTCLNFEGLSGIASSAKFAGSNTDYRTDGITFFNNTYFQGSEEYAISDLPNLTLSGSIESLIITGLSGWTIYDGINYGGNAFCLQPIQSPYYDPMFVLDTLDLVPSIPHGSIESVRKGCLPISNVSAQTTSMNILNNNLRK